MEESAKGEEIGEDKGPETPIFNGQTEEEMAVKETEKEPR